MFRKKKIFTLMESLAQAGICLDVEPGTTLLRGLKETGYFSERHLGIFTVKVNDDFTDLIIMENDSPIASAYMDEAYSQNGSGYWRILLLPSLEVIYASKSFGYELNCSSPYNLAGKLIEYV